MLRDSAALEDEVVYRRVMAILRAIVVAVFVLYAVFFIYHGVRVAAFPYDVDNGESYVLNEAVRIAQGQTPYRPIDEPPYLVANYPPLYTALVALPVRLWGVSFAWGRSLSLLASLGTGLVLFLFILRASGDRFAAAVAGLLWFASYYVYEWTPFHRVDSLAVFLSLLGLFYAGRSPGWPVGVACFVLALLTRQTMIFAPLAAGAYWAFQGERRRALAIPFLSFGIAGALYLILHALSGGEFLRHTIAYNANAYIWAFFMNFVRHFQQLHPGFLIFGLFYLIWSLTRRRIDLTVTYLILAGLSTILSGKIGAASNYMLEFVAALCLAVGMVLAEIRLMEPERRRLGEILALAILLVQAGVLFHVPHHRDYAPTPVAGDTKGLDALSQRITLAPGDVLAEDDGLLLLNGKPITYQCFVFNQLAIEGRWDPEPVHDAIRRKHYGLIVLSFDVRQRESTDRFGKPLLDLVREHYTPAGVYPGPTGGNPRGRPWWSYWVYEPKD